MLWITYLFFSLAAVSCALTTVSFLAIAANGGLSRGMFNASAMMTVVYTALSLATGHLVG